MDVDFLIAKGRKRAAEEIPPVESVHRANDVPRILRRHHHRRRNVAATVWGPDVLLTPTTPLPVGNGPSTAPSSSYTPAISQAQVPFNIYKALLRHPNLFFQFALRLPYPLIISLYAIDKEFHYRLNKYSVSLIHDYAKYHAPLASHIFTWMLYPDLCISDPMLRPMDGREWLARDVPGFRWIGMALWRERVVRGILTRMIVGGGVGNMPAGVEAAVMKYWCLMETKTTALRLAFLQDTSIWTDEDIVLFQLFLVKLDMFIADPVLGNGVCLLSHMLLTQKSLSMLHRVLTGKLRLDYDQTTDILVRTYLTEDLDTDTHPWLDDELDNGVPEEEWGLMCKEGWDVDGKRMESGVDMVITEGIRRELHVQQHYLDFVMFGFVDSATGKNLPQPRRWRGDKGIVVPEEGWPTEEFRISILEGLDERFGVLSMSR
ncbi:hypothetical protein P153DRAFT_299766 [Dothidotthia symphoricarpi CBS 119687]|uniref:Uncharacterized protein n=1 Tax=Dothidotthia symphoricarpi CBS 119687 TaxID=1392245 RepID=A0A6A6A0I2_9PLEO|nr:uncharacterized protein P153DRAFT_299766 [Dothidotthia symphoricarpi CBS 119687]KAF2125320.1 hypothetical protein P153DRAFT_299766 [Dothidotthia symphoricarpi CBS 119687]